MDETSSVAEELSSLPVMDIDNLDCIDANVHASTDGSKSENEALEDSTFILEKEESTSAVLENKESTSSEEDLDSTENTVAIGASTDVSDNEISLAVSENANSSGDDVHGSNYGDMVPDANLEYSVLDRNILNGDIIKKTLICSVCLGDHNNSINEIMECDRCTVTVHEGCYGVQESISFHSTTSSCSTEPWFCESCGAGVYEPECELCPNKGGIFKETNVGAWVHLICALYTPNVKFLEEDALSNISLFEIPPSKWGKNACELCENSDMMKTGITVLCETALCRAYFHATCAQREGLLPSITSSNEYSAHCKAHSVQPAIRIKKRNWLALEYRTKVMRQKMDVERLENTPLWNRNERKLDLYKQHYAELKTRRSPPFIPVQKVPRMLTTNPRACRELARKTQKMGITRLGYYSIQEMIDEIKELPKKWKIEPSLSCQFAGYFFDRENRITKFKSQVEKFETEYDELSTDSIFNLCRSYQTDRNELIYSNTCLETTIEYYHGLFSICKPDLKVPSIKSLIYSGKPVTPIPAQSELSGHAASKGNEPSTSSGHRVPSIRNESNQSTLSQPESSSKNSSSFQFPILTAAALKEGIGFPFFELYDNPKPTLTLSATAVAEMMVSCATCNKVSYDSSALVKCDTCEKNYHLGCLVPPLTKMPKKTKQMGWQCSECDNTINTLEVEPVDTNAPRTLRRVGGDRKSIKSPTSSENSINEFEDDMEDEDIPKRQCFKKPRAYKRRRKSGSLDEQQNQESVPTSSEMPRQGIKLFIKSVPNKNGSSSNFLSTPLATTSAFVTKTEEYVTSSSSDSPSSPKQTTTKVIENQCETCDTCNNIGTNLNMVKCDDCDKCFHFGCLDPPVKKSPKVRGYSWHCAECDTAESDSGKNV